MQTWVLVVALLILGLAGYYLGRSRAVASADGRAASLHSVPSYYGMYVAIWAAVPGLILVLIWLSIAPIVRDNMVLSAIPPETVTAWAQEMLPADLFAAEAEAIAASGTDGLTGPQVELLMVNIVNVAAGSSFVSPTVAGILVGPAEHMNSLGELSSWGLLVIGLGLACAGLYSARRRLAPHFRARNRVESIINVFLIICSTIAILTTLGIVLSLLFESARFFGIVPIWEFLFGTQWSPQIAIRADQVGSSGAFGAIPLFVGTLLIAAIAMLVAVPVGLMSAIYLSDYAPPRVRASVKPVLEILAGIPTVVYGFFAILTVAPFIRDLGAAVGLNVSANSALAAGVVMGIMIVPFISSLSDDVINAVPQSLRDGSAALGATKSETIRQVILPAALPGIVGACLLAVSRAIGETMIVVMAAGLAANLTVNPFAAVTTVTVQIATLLVGDQEFDSAKTLSAFALGLMLFVVTLCLNVIALRVVKKYREKYD